MIKEDRESSCHWNGTLRYHQNIADCSCKGGKLFLQAFMTTHTPFTNFINRCTENIDIVCDAEQSCKRSKSWWLTSLWEEVMAWKGNFTVESPFKLADVSECDVVRPTIEVKLPLPTTTPAQGEVMTWRVLSRDCSAANHAANHQQRATSSSHLPLTKLALFVWVQPWRRARGEIREIPFCWDLSVLLELCAQLREPEAQNSKFGYLFLVTSKLLYLSSFSIVLFLFYVFLIAIWIFFFFLQKKIFNKQLVLPM